MKTKFFVLIVFLSTLFFGCVQNPQEYYDQPQSTGQVVVNELQPAIGDNLNLNAVGELIKQCQNPQEIEQRLNADGQINNLDMNGDGQRDYLTVTETSKGTYKITDVQQDGNVDIANVSVDIQNNTINLYGNPQYYGNNSNYQTNFSTTDFLLMSYLMRPHYSYYVSPYHYGYYGYGYRPVPVVSYNSYHSSPYVTTARTKTTYKTVTTTTTKSSPTFKNSSKSVETHASTHGSLSNPTQSQKSFQVRDNSQPTKKGGFGNNKTTNTSSGSSYKNPSSSSGSSYKSPSSGSSYKSPSSGSSYKSPSSGSSYKSPSSSGSKSWGSKSSSSSSSKRK
jgi:hypothetical protein